MALFRYSSTSLFLLIHIALLSTLSLAADPTVSYDFKLSYITVSPLGVPQKVPLDSLCRLYLFHFLKLCSWGF